MIKKALLSLFILIILSLLLIVFYVADRVDANFNPTTLSKPYSFTERSTKLLNSLDFIADLHCDALMWQRNLNKEHSFGHVDIPRLQKGNVAFQAFTMVTKSPDGLNFESNDSESDRITKLVIGQGKPYYTWFSLFGRAKYQCKQLQKASEENPFFTLIGSKNDLEKFIEKRKTDKRHVAAFLGAEGGHCLEGKVENLDKLYDLGVRMLGPTHFFDNELGGSAHGRSKAGLSDFGKEIIRKMVDKKMIIDIAHSSDALIEDILAMTESPIISSHTGVNGTCNSSRNLSDQQLRAIARSNGLVGIAYFDGATCGNDIPSIVKAMKYTKDLIGAEYVALGSDYDGTVSVPFDTTGLALLIEEMFQQGFSESDIRLIMGENVKRFLLENL